MAEIRKTVELFCTILHENGFSKIKAETLRQAKFDNNEVAPVLWKLLFELLFFAEHGTIDNRSEEQFTKMPKEEAAVYLKTTMWERGYLASAFYSLPNDMAVGSRAVLLAVGWVLGREQTIEHLMKKCAAPLASDTSNQLDTSFDEIFPHEGQVATDVMITLNQLLHLNNQLQGQLKQLSSGQREQALLQHKLHEATFGASTDPDRNHLNMMEIHLLRHPELLEKNLEVIQNDSARLAHLLSWETHEEIFWKWMESTLDADNSKPVNTGLMMQTPDGTSSPSEEGAVGGYDSSQAVAAIGYICLDGSMKDLENTVDKYEAIIQAVEKDLQNQRSTIKEEELDNVIRELDREVRTYKQELAQYKPKGTPSPDLHLPMAATTYILDKGDRRVFNQPSRTIPPLEDAQAIEDEVSMLEQAAQDLFRATHDQRETLEQDLSELNQSFNDVLVIPPMNQRKKNYLN